MKKFIREALLEKRGQLSAEEVQYKSKSIFRELSSTEIYQRSSNVMLYISFRNEVHTGEIIDDLLSIGKKVFIPIAVPSTREILVSELRDPDKDLEVGNYGVLEPKREAVRVSDPGILDLILVPGVAFDEKGYRIGYGAGYYDRFLPGISPSVPTVGLAFELQMTERLPREKYDFAVQYIITEARFITAKNNQRLPTDDLPNY